MKRRRGEEEGTGGAEGEGEGEEEEEQEGEEVRKASKKEHLRWRMLLSAC